MSNGEIKLKTANEQLAELRTMVDEFLANNNTKFANFKEEFLLAADFSLPAVCKESTIRGVGNISIVFLIEPVLLKSFMRTFMTNSMGFPGNSINSSPPNHPCGSCI